MEELAIDLKALDPTGEVNLYILLITNRYKGKSTIICLNIAGPRELTRFARTALGGATGMYKGEAD